ncbi:MDR family oxidoreductase [Methylocystis bryophila]|uniref:Oxidoreductase n=1 Tax=Methylocystis bryophila TaxID=655015 RepID=A0A1W6MSL9_9HYPH|nr:MDR family oxidoreductase [Methylocystis bryophila]ARN80594.1 oxidoreductase [Methylocystis bryophila]BDV40646.1 alcohol dehydrogenase [Methylocystis bryophila]
MATFSAIRIDRDEAGQRAAYVVMHDAELMNGDVEIEITHSTLNYKDGLAITSKGPVVRRFPMIPGVDFTGRVMASTHPGFHSGDLVVAGGCGLGEAHYGGLAQKARVSGEWLAPLPEGISPEEAMTIGTAGVTAMFCVMALERFGLEPTRGPIVVTGAAGGVGSIAVALLARSGWRVIAITGRQEEADYLIRLGAAEVIDRNEFAAPGKALQQRRFAAGVDTVGSTTLANILSQIDYDGAVAACGNARGMDLPGSVAPFILRGVSLLGVESVRPRLEMRREAWTRIARELDHAALAEIRETIPFSQALARAKDLIDGKARGRIVVEIG